LPAPNVLAEESPLTVPEVSELSRAGELISSWRFTPHRRLADGHLQTIAAHFWRRSFASRITRAEARTIEVEPGSQVVALCSWQRDRHERPTLLLVHGLEGSADSRYMLGTADKALAAGWNAVRLNMRNCGETEHLSPTLYNSGMSADVAAVIEHLIAVERVDRLAVVGFSLGGNLVLKMAGEYGSNIPGAVRALAVVSPAVDLSASAASLERRSNILYHARFVRSLKARMRRKAKLFPGRYDLSRLRGLWTIRQYDERYIAPLFGYRDAEDYYERASARTHIAGIRVPALMLHAHDDPFIPFTERVRREAEGNPFVRVAMTDRGGHVGWVGENAEGEDRHWAENRVVEWAVLRTSAEC
jgi:predicted alpha/beta-fold hydrolase